MVIDMRLDVSRMSLMTFAMGFDIFTKRMSVEQSLCLARECGVPTVDVMNVPEKTIAVYQNAMRNTGVKIYCYIANISFFKSPDFIASTIRQELETAHRLGAQLLMIVPGGAPEIKRARRMERTQILEQMAQGFQTAVDLSQSTDITVCFETTPHEALRLSGNDDSLELLNMVPGLGLVLDTANMLPHGDTTIDAYEKLKDWIMYVHLKDVELIDRRTIFSVPERAADGRIMRCTVWGHGEIPIRPLYEKMLQDGYTGQFAIEYVPPKVKKRTMDDHLRQLRLYLNY